MKNKSLTHPHPSPPLEGEGESCIFRGKGDPMRGKVVFSEGKEVLC